MRKVALASVLVAAILAWGTAATAATIYTNGGIGNNGFISDTDFGPTGQFSADDFVLNPNANVVTDIHWTGSYFPSNTPQAVDNFTTSFLRIFRAARPSPRFLPWPSGTRAVRIRVQILPPVQIFSAIQSTSLRYSSIPTPGSGSPSSITPAWTRTITGSGQYRILGATELPVPTQLARGRL